MDEASPPAFCLSLCKTTIAIERKQDIPDTFPPNCGTVCRH